MSNNVATLVFESHVRVCVCVRTISCYTLQVNKKEGDREQTKRQLETTTTTTTTTMTTIRRMQAT